MSASDPWRYDGNDRTGRVLSGWPFRRKHIAASDTLTDVSGFPAKVVVSGSPM